MASEVTSTIENGHSQSATTESPANSLGAQLQSKLEEVAGSLKSLDAKIDRLNLRATRTNNQPDASGTLPTRLEATSVRNRLQPYVRSPSGFAQRALPIDARKRPFTGPQEAPATTRKLPRIHSVVVAKDGSESTPKLLKSNSQPNAERERDSQEDGELRDDRPAEEQDSNPRLHAAANSDAERGRQRRLFGVLLGTLQRFQVENAQHQDKLLQKTKVEEKVQEKLVRLNAELKEERQKLFSERDARRADLKNLEEKRKELELFEKWAREKRHLRNFIATTKSKSAIYYLPRVLNERAEKLRKENAELVETQIAARREGIEKEIAELLARVSLPLAEQQEADPKPAASQARRSVKSRLSTISVSEKDTGDLMNEPVRLEDPLALVHFVDADPIADTESPPPPPDTSTTTTTIESRADSASAAVAPAPEEKLDATPSTDAPTTSAMDATEAHVAVASESESATNPVVESATAPESAERSAEGSPDSRAYAPGADPRVQSQGLSPNSGTMGSVL